MLAASGCSGVSLYGKSRTVYSLTPPKTHVVDSLEITSMALIGSSLANEVGLRLLLSPLNTNIVVRTACCSVGIGIPVYCTFKAIEKRDQNEQQKWLIYWAAYGSFSIVEVFGDKLLSWFPLYYHLKFAFLVWLQLPTTEGAKQLYDNHLRPFLLRRQAKIDRFIDSAYGQVAKIVSAHQVEIRFAKGLVVKMVSSVRGTSISDQPRHNTTEDQTTAEETSMITASSDNGSDLDE